MSVPVTETHVPSFGRDRVVHGWLAVKGVSDAGDAAWTIAVAWTVVQLASPAVAGLVPDGVYGQRASVAFTRAVSSNNGQVVALSRMPSLSLSATLAWMPSSSSRRSPTCNG